MLHRLHMLPTLIAAFLLLAVTLPQIACSGVDTEAREARENGATKDPGEEGEDEDTTVPVQVATLSLGAIEAKLRLSTNLEAENEVQVLAEASRQVRKLLVEEGDVVRRGQLLVNLQDDEQRTTLAKVESELRKVRREYERQQRLYAQGFLSEEDLSNATYQIEQLELREEESRRQLSYTEVRAPIAGTVTQRRVSLGDYVTPNQPLFDLVDFGSIVARVFVPEKELVHLQSGQEARISAPSLGEEVYHGKIDRIAPIVDPQTGTVKVTVSLPDNRDGASQKATGTALRPGLYVDVELVTAVHPDALLIPKRALVYDQDQVFIYRLMNNESVERLALRVLLEEKDFVEAEGKVKLGDQVIVAGQAGLKDGAEVRLVGPLAGARESLAEAVPEDKAARKEEARTEEARTEETP
ncbi:MAG: efflux RND transporter periplasmic adaptor subunit [Deltaproteobacteria bacterium]|nr:efflux RND transporter periplasmic adaptor subunit [Deltaproteobacteria bacterium]